jgi:hypothetical protein
MNLGYEKKGSQSKHFSSVYYLKKPNGVKEQRGVPLVDFWIIAKDIWLKDKKLLKIKIKNNN